MAEPARTSPLAALAAPSARVPGPEPVALAALPFRGKLVLRGGERRARAGGRARSGWSCRARCAAPRPAETAALWLGPDEWLVLTAPDAAEPLGGGAAARRLAGTHHAVVVGQRPHDRHRPSPAARARDVLNAGCPLDLHPRRSRRARSRGRCSAKAPVVLRRPAEAEAFELWVNGSFAPYAWLFLENAAREFGVDHCRLARRAAVAL